MLTIVVAAHKEVQVAEAVGDAGREVDAWQGPNQQGGWHEVLGWAKCPGRECRWGVEGAWNYGRGSRSTWSRRAVSEVNPRLTAEGDFERAVPA